MQEAEYPKINYATEGGGIVARRGMGYQDYVAAKFIVEMLFDDLLLGVRFEVDDDIDLLWKCSQGDLFIEFVQVKSTDGNTKWKIDELLAKTAKNKDNSIYGKSLKCDQYSGIKSKFKFVFMRDISNSGHVKLLKLSQQARINHKDYEALCKKIDKGTNSEKSPNGNDAKYWCDNFNYEYLISPDQITSQAVSKLTSIFNNHGFRPLHSDVKNFFNKLLNIAYQRSLVSRINNVEGKQILKAEVFDLFQGAINSLSNSDKSETKVYQPIDSKSLFEIVFSENKNNICGKGLNLGYHFSKWNLTNLLDELEDFLPEFSLSPKEIANAGHRTRTLSRKAIERIKYDMKNEPEKVISSLILHSIIRTLHFSEPVLCDLFVYYNDESYSIKNAYIVQSNGELELWLGISSLIYQKKLKNAISTITSQIESILDKGFLEQGRSVILNKKDDGHYKYNQINSVLSDSTPISELINILRIPVCFTYDSEFIKDTELEDYKSDLRNEIKNYFEIYLATTNKCNSTIGCFDIKVIIYMLPIKCVNELSSELNKRIYR